MLRSTFQNKGFFTFQQSQQLSFNSIDQAQKYIPQQNSSIESVHLTDCELQHKQPTVNNQPLIGQQQNEQIGDCWFWREGEQGIGIVRSCWYSYYKHHKSIQMVTYSTGFLVGSRLIVLCAHALFNQRRKTYADQLYFLPNFNKTQLNKKYIFNRKIQSYKSIDKQFYKHKSLLLGIQTFSEVTTINQLCLVVLQKQIALKQYITIANIKLNQGDRLDIIGYPSKHVDKITEIQKINIPRIHLTGQFVSANQYILHHNLKTDIGFSGAPILRQVNGKLVAVGIHTHRGDGEINCGLMFTHKIVNLLKRYQKQLVEKHGIQQRINYMDETGEGISQLCPPLKQQEFQFILQRKETKSQKMLESRSMDRKQRGRNDSGLKKKSGKGGDSSYYSCYEWKSGEQSSNLVRRSLFSCSSMSKISNIQIKSLGQKQIQSDLSWESQYSWHSQQQKYIKEQKKRQLGYSLCGQSKKYWPISSQNSEKHQESQNSQLEQIESQLQSMFNDSQQHTHLSKSEIFGINQSDLSCIQNEDSINKPKHQFQSNYKCQQYSYGDIIEFLLNQQEESQSFDSIKQAKIKNKEIQQAELQSLLKDFNI